MNLQQLQNQSLEQVNDYKQNALARKAELEAAKAKGGKGWTTDMQEELDEIALFLVDVEEVIEEKKKAASTGYVVKPGTEKLVHLKLVKGRRFNSKTGKEISKPYIQMFTFSEWQLFKSNFKGLGYIIVEALHDPYGDAKALEDKEMKESK